MLSMQENKNAQHKNTKRHKKKKIKTQLNMRKAVRHSK